MKEESLSFGGDGCTAVLDEYSCFLKQFEEETKSKFVILRVEAPFNDKEWQPPAEAPRVYWEWSQKSIPFNGVPFIFVGSSVMVCHQGKDFDLKRKMQRRAEAKSKETDHSCPKRRRLPRDTKKVGCPAEVHITRICTFPAFKLIGRDSLRARQAAARRLKDALAKDPVVWGNLYIVKTPPVSAHEGHPVMGEPGNVQDLPCRKPSNNLLRRQCVSTLKNITESVHLLNSKRALLSCKEQLTSLEATIKGMVPVEDGLQLSLPRKRRRVSTTNSATVPPTQHFR